ncbi:MAG: transcriptional repressor [Verrucomicrobia bacterium]|nr:transcriptional repressor [Verrucomicrobiota bacterium]
MNQLKQMDRGALSDALGHSGHRTTPQRETVFGVLLDDRDHPTADEVYTRTKSRMPSISMATVYNCLEALVSCGLVKQVNIEREPTRYCPNLSPHAHFHCRETGRVYDVPVPDGMMQNLAKMLSGEYSADSVELVFRGHLAKGQEK